MKISEEYFDFETDGDTKLISILEKAVSFSNDYEPSKKEGHWLTFLGSCGVGKTHLAKRILKYVKDHHTQYLRRYGITQFRSNLFSYWPDIVDALRGGDYGRLNPLYSADFLAIDDLGAEYASDYINSKLQQLLNKRLNKWTVITSNLSLDDFSHKDERIASRLVRGGNQVIQIDATDYYLKHYANP